VFGLFIYPHTSCQPCTVIHFRRGVSDGKTSKAEPGEGHWDSGIIFPETWGARFFSFPLSLLHVECPPRNLRSSDSSLASSTTLLEGWVTQGESSGKPPQAQDVSYGIPGRLANLLKS
jgi:hypothetical protein